MRRQHDYAHADGLVRLVVDALLDARAFDPYWLDLPLSQRELTSRDFLRGGDVPREVLERIQMALEARDRCSYK